MKKLILLLMVIVMGAVFPARAFIVAKTVKQVLDEIKKHERLSSREYKQLKRQFLKGAQWETDYAKLLGKPFSVNIENLRIIKPFIKRKGNPLFQGWLAPAIRHDDVEEVRFLVTELGVDVNAGGQDSALAGTISVEMVKLLLAVGANQDTFFSVGEGKSSNEITLLELEALCVFYERDYSVTKKKIEALLHHGARMDAVGSQGHDLFQLLELQCDAYERDIRDGSNNCHILADFHKNREMLANQLNLSAVPQNAKDWQAAGVLQPLEKVRSRIEALREIPAIAEKFAVRQSLELRPFLPHGVAGHVVEYLHEHAAQEYKKREEEKDAKQLPQVLETVGGFLPAWQQQESARAYRLERLNPVQLIGEYVCQQEAEYAQDGQGGEVESDSGENLAEQESKEE